MRAKELEDMKYRDAHLLQACSSKSSKSSFIPDQVYCAVCTPLDRKCPSEFPAYQDWKDSKEVSECSDWDADLEEQDRQRQELENKQANETKTPLRKPKFLPVALTFQTHKPPAR